MANDTYYTLIQKLGENLQNTLPGEAAHKRMQALTQLRFTFKPNAKTRKSAVLILFYPYQGRIYFPVIVRPTYDGAHSGQIAFPGGRYELSDEDLIRTAKREAQEEIGLRLNDVKILGTLTEFFIPISNFQILPVIGTIPYKPDFYPDEREVDSILQISLDEIKNDNILGVSELDIRGEKVLAPHYKVQGRNIWGATAMIISELLEVIEGKPQANQS